MLTTYTYYPANNCSFVGMFTHSTCVNSSGACSSEGCGYGSCICRHLWIVLSALPPLHALVLLQVSVDTLLNSHSSINLRQGLSWSVLWEEWMRLDCFIILILWPHHTHNINYFFSECRIFHLKRTRVAHWWTAMPVSLEKRGPCEGDRRQWNMVTEQPFANKKLISSWQEKGEATKNAYYCVSL